MLKKEIHYFFNALMFYSRIPCPKWVSYTNENLNRSRKYFPLVGWIIGAIGAIVFYLTQLFLPVGVAILLSMISTILATGAFHEDGFADVCDSFGGGWSKAQILTIMKDSRVGAYGTIGMILILGLKFCCLFYLSESLSVFLPALVCAHVSSRFIASTFIETHEYVQDLDKSKSKPITSSRLSKAEISYSFIFVLLAILVENHLTIAFAVAFVIAYLSKIYLAFYFQKHIGGYTGDCLGTTQQVSEVVFYLSILGWISIL